MKGPGRVGLALMFAVMAWAGCQAPAEEFELPDWTPIVAVPLVDTEFDLADVLRLISEQGDSLPLETGTGGQLVFIYEEDFTGTLAEEWLLLPDVDQSSELALDPTLADALNILPPGDAVTISDTLTVEMIVENPPGALIDDVVLATGQLVFTLNSTMGDEVSGQLTIPNLLDAEGNVWTTTWNADDLTDGSHVVQEQLEGWRILPVNAGGQDTNLISATFDVQIVNNPGHTAEPGESLAATFDMGGMMFTRVEGDFGSSEISLEESVTTFTLFDDRFTVSDVAIEEVTAVLEVTNGFGVEAILDSIKFEAVEDGVVTVELETTALPLLVPPAAGSHQSPSVSSLLFDADNSNLSDFFSVEPREIALRAWVRSNPNGVDVTAPNFMDSEGYVRARFRSEIPLALRIGQLDLVDTLDFNLDLEEEATLDSVELRVILHNGFPFGVELAAHFLDADGAAVDSLALSPLPLFTMPAVDADGLPLEPAVFVHDFRFDWERSQRLSTADRVVVNVWASTADAQDGAFVKLTEEQALRMELAARIFTRIEQ